MLHYTADSLKFTIPSDWSEMSLGRFLSFLDAETDADMLAALSGVSLDQLRPLRAPDLSQIVRSLAYLEDAPDFSTMPAPTSITLAGQTIKIFDDLGSNVTYGQKTDADQAIKEVIESGQKANYATLSRQLLAIFLFPLLTGSRYEDRDQATILSPDIDQLPVTVALPLAAFFLTSCTSRITSGRLSYKAVQEPMKTTYLNRLLVWLKGWRNMTSSLPLSK